MITFVNTGVVMENGCKELKDVGDIVCPSIEDDGVYHAFKELGLI